LDRSIDYDDNLTRPPPPRRRSRRFFNDAPVSDRSSRAVFLKARDRSSSSFAPSVPSARFALAD